MALGRARARRRRGRRRQQHRCGVLGVVRGVGEDDSATRDVNDARVVAIDARRAARPAASTPPAAAAAAAAAKPPSPAVRAGNGGP